MAHHKGNMNVVWVWFVIWRCTHLGMLNSICHLLDHVCSLIRSDCRMLLSVSDVIFAIYDAVVSKELYGRLNVVVYVIYI